MKLNYQSLTMLTGVVLLSGCGRMELPYTDNSRDPMAYAQDIKTLVASAARRAKRAQEPADYLGPVALELQRTDRPVGDFRTTYNELRTRVDQLVRDCERAGGRAPNLSGRCDELIKLAQSLPGEMPTGSQK